MTETTQALTTPDQNRRQLDAYAEAEWVDSGTDDIDIQFPLVKLTQAVSRMEGADKHGGEFWRSDLQTYYPELVVVPLFRKSTRAYFEDEGEQPICSSDDGTYPRDNQPLWQGQEEPASCADCQFSQWPEDGQGDPPPCRESWMILADHEDQLVTLRVSGKSMRPWRQFIRNLPLMSVRGRMVRLPLCSHELTLTSERQSEGGRVWFETRIQKRMLDVAEAARYNAVLKYQQERFEQEVAVHQDDYLADEPVG